VTMSRSSRAQRTAVTIGAALLLVLGTGMAIASGATGSLKQATPQVIESNRPVEAAVAPATPSAPITYPSVKTNLKRLTKPEYDPGLPTVGPRTSSNKPAASGRKTKDSDRQTVTPPVRDDDDDDHETVTPPVRDDDDDEPESGEGRDSGTDRLSD